MLNSPSSSSSSSSTHLEKTSKYLPLPKVTSTPASLRLKQQAASKSVLEKRRLRWQNWCTRQWNFAKAAFDAKINHAKLKTEWNVHSKWILTFIALPFAYYISYVTLYQLSTTPPVANTIPHQCNCMNKGGNLNSNPYQNPSFAHVQQPQAKNGGEQKKQQSQYPTIAVEEYRSPVFMHAEDSLYEDLIVMKKLAHINDTVQDIISTSSHVVMGTRNSHRMACRHWVLNQGHVTCIQI